MLQSSVLKRLSLIFIALSMLLWVAEIFLDWEESCRSNLANNVSKIEMEGKIIIISLNKMVLIIANELNDIFIAGVASKWFKKQLLGMSPTPLTLQTRCHVLNASSSKARGREIGMLAVLGEVHLRLGSGGSGGMNEHHRTLVSRENLMTWLRNVTARSLIGEADAVLTNFPTLIRKTETSSAQNVLRYVPPW